MRDLRRTFQVFHSVLVAEAMISQRATDAEYALAVVVEEVRGFDEASVLASAEDVSGGGVEFLAGGEAMEFGEHLVLVLVATGVNVRDAIGGLGVIQDILGQGWLDDFVDDVEE